MADLPESIRNNEELLNAVNSWHNEEVTGLKSNKDQILQSLHQLKSTLEELGGMDIIKQKLQDHNKVTQQATSIEEQIRIKDGKIQALQNSLLNGTTKDKLSGALKSAKVKDDAIPDLLSVISSRIKSELDDNNNVRTTVLNHDGKPMLNENGDPVEVNDLVESYRNHPLYGAAFGEASKEVSGTGQVITGPTKKRGRPIDNPFAKNTDAFNVGKQMELLGNPETKDLAIQMMKEANYSIPGI